MITPGSIQRSGTADGDGLDKCNEITNILSGNSRTGQKQKAPQAAGLFYFQQCCAALLKNALQSTRRNDAQNLSTRQVEDGMRGRPL
jgi:hypothetical protein